MVSIKINSKIYKTAMSMLKGNALQKILLAANNHKTSCNHLTIDLLNNIINLFLHVQILHWLKWPLHVLQKISFATEINNAAKGQQI